MEPLFTLLAPAPSGRMKIMHEGMGFKFLFENAVDMAKVFVLGLPHAFVHIEEEAADCIQITTQSSHIWEETWSCEGDVNISVREFLERCGMVFGNSSSRDSATSPSPNPNPNNNNNTTSGNNSNSGSNSQQPNPSFGSQSSSEALPGNKVQIQLKIQNDCGEGLEEDTKLDLAKKPEAMCAIRADLIFIFTMADDLIPPFLRLELGINTDFRLLSESIVSDLRKGNRVVGNRIGVLHDKLQCAYQGDTISSLSLDDARVLELYSLEVGKKKLECKAVGTEIEGDFTILGGHAPVASGGGRIEVKRTKLITPTAESSKVMKVSALVGSAFTMVNRCRRPLRAADVLSFRATHLPQMDALKCLEDAGLSLKKGTEMVSSLGKSMRVSVEGTFLCQLGQVHTHTLVLSREMGEVEVTKSRSFLGRLIRRKPITTMSMVTGSQTLEIQLRVNHAIDFSLYGSKKLVWIAKSFDNAVPNLVNVIPQ